MDMDSHILRLARGDRCFAPSPPKLHWTRRRIPVGIWEDLGCQGAVIREYSKHLSTSLQQPPACDQCQVYIVHHKTTPLWAWNARTMPATNGTAYRGVCIVHNHIPLAFGHLQFNTSDSWMFRAHQPLQRTQDTTPMYSLACYTPDPYDQDHCPSHRMHRTPKNTPLLKVRTYFMPLYYLICFNLKQCWMHVWADIAHPRTCTTSPSTATKFELQLDQISHTLAPND